MCVDFMECLTYNFFRESDFVAADVESYFSKRITETALRVPTCFAQV